MDGTLTDSTVYYSKKGEELKQFSHRDGRGFHLLKHNSNVKTFLITSENKGINQARAKKFLKLKTIEKYINSFNKNKLSLLKEICIKYNCTLDECAFIGDDNNDKECLEAVKYKACPYDAHESIKKIYGIKVMQSNGGHGAVRCFIDYLFKENLLAGAFYEH